MNKITFNKEENIVLELSPTSFMFYSKLKFLLFNGGEIVALKVKRGNITQTIDISGRAVVE